MNTEEVGKKLVDYCRNGEWMKALDDLYSKDIVSVEAQAGENMPAEMRGIDQVRGKTAWWEKNFEVHSAKVGGPFVVRYRCNRERLEETNADVRGRNLHRQRRQSRPRGISAAGAAERVARASGLPDLSDSFLGSAKSRRFRHKSQARMLALP